MPEEFCEEKILKLFDYMSEYYLGTSALHMTVEKEYIEEMRKRIQHKCCVQFVCIDCGKRSNKLGLCECHKNKRRNDENNSQD